MVQVACFLTISIIVVLILLAVGTLKIKLLQPRAFFPEESKIVLCLIGELFYGYMGRLLHTLQNRA